MFFADVRRALDAQRNQISERLEAVDQAEAALARVAEVFGLPLGPSQGRQDARGAVDAAILPPEAASPAHANGAGGATANCAICSAPFAQRASGKTKLYCSAKCRQQAYAQRKQPKLKPSTLEPEPEPAVADWPRPLAVPLEDHGESTELLRPPAMPWEAGIAPTRTPRP